MSKQVLVVIPVEERHKETTEAYKSMSEMLDKHEKELSKSQRKIWKLNWFSTGSAQPEAAARRSREREWQNLPERSF